jgi:hypothetical protein
MKGLPAMADKWTRRTWHSALTRCIVTSIDT